MKLNSQERRILFEKKVKSGLSKDQAYKEVEMECRHLEQLTKSKRENNKNSNLDFKAEFEKLKNGQGKI